MRHRLAVAVEEGGHQRSERRAVDRFGDRDHPHRLAAGVERGVGARPQRQIAEHARDTQHVARRRIGDAARERIRLGERDVRPRAQLHAGARDADLELLRPSAAIRAVGFDRGEVVRGGLGEDASERAVGGPSQIEHLAAGGAGEMFDAFHRVVGSEEVRAGDVLALQRARLEHHVSGLDHVELGARRARRFGHLAKQLAAQLAHARRHGDRRIAPRAGEPPGDEHDRDRSFADAELAVEITRKRLERPPGPAGDLGAGLVSRGLTDDLHHRAADPRVVGGERHFHAAVGHVDEGELIARRQPVDQRVDRVADRRLPSRLERIVLDDQHERAAALAAGVGTEGERQRAGGGGSITGGHRDQLQGLDRAPSSADADRDVPGLQTRHRTAIARHHGEVDGQQRASPLGRPLRLLARLLLRCRQRQAEKGRGQSLRVRHGQEDKRISLARSPRIPHLLSSEMLDIVLQCFGFRVQAYP